MKKSFLFLLLTSVLLVSCGGGTSNSPAASFTIADKTVNITAGADPLTATTSVTRTNDFSAPIALNTSTIPAGITLTFKNTPVTGSDPVTFNVAAPTAAPGTYTTAITGTGGGITASAKLTIIVSAQPANTGAAPTMPSNSGNNYPAASPASADHAFQGMLTAPTASGTADLDCRDFTSQSEAQLYFNSKGGSVSNNVDALDWNHNGKPCEVNEDWAVRSKRWPTPSAPKPPVVTPTPPVAAPGNGGRCYVNGYRRANGTYVSGYYRSC